MMNNGYFWDDGEEGEGIAGGDDPPRRFPIPMRPETISRTVILPFRRDGERILFPSVVWTTVVRSIVAAPFLHGIFLVLLPPAIPDPIPLGHLAPDALFRSGLVIAKLEPGMEVTLGLIERHNEARLEFEGSAVCEQVQR